MPSNKALVAGDFDEFNKLTDVKKRTQEDRDRMYGYFYDFLEKNGVIEGRSLGEVLKTEEGRVNFSKMHAAFFFTLRVRDDEIPKLATAESIRSHIKIKILKDFNIDIANPENFPNDQATWRKYTIMLTKEGKSMTKHKEEIPPDTMDALWMLFSVTQSALENRSSDCYVSDYLSKIDLDLHDQLNKVMMFGACFLAIFFEARRGQEGLEFLKQTDFKQVHGHQRGLQRGHTIHGYHPR